MRLCVRCRHLALPIAVATWFLVAALFMRSVRYAFVTIIPMGLVVAWLYAMMYLLGFDLNFVTATIGAISIGVGVDFSIHLTQRFREEMARVGDGMMAIERAAKSTGMALIASAASSVAGFAIMGFAPMSMFSAYGTLTAVMVFMAAAAALLVLPSLLSAASAFNSSRSALNRHTKTPPARSSTMLSRPKASMATLPAWTPTHNETPASTKFHRRPASTRMSAVLRRASDSSNRDDCSFLRVGLPLLFRQGLSSP